MPLFRINNRVVFFAHVPKTGGTSVETALGAAGTICLHRNIDDAPIPPQHWHAEIYERLLPRELYDYGFMVVRNPFSRLISEYRVRAQRHFEDGAAPPFSLWAEEAFAHARADPTVLANHLRPQTHFFSRHLEVFHFEHGLQRVIDRVLASCGIGRELIAHKNRSSPMVANLPDATIDEIQAFYDDDFRHFSYDRSVDCLLKAGRVCRISAAADRQEREKFLATGQTAMKADMREMRLRRRPARARRFSLLRRLVRAF